MAKKAKENRFLRVNKEVALTFETEPVIVGLDKYFEEAKVVANIISCLRTEQEQLDLLKSVADQFGVTTILS